jgi:hypothetical protein
MKVSTAHHSVQSRVVGQSGLEAHYRTLQLSPSADLELVERTYWLLAFRYHHQGQREALRRLNEAMSAVVSALADEGAVGGRTAAATEPRPGALTTLAWEAGWLIVTASAVSLTLGLAAGAMELKGGLQVLEEWHGVMVGGGAFGLGAVATTAALASFVPALGRFLRSHVPQTAALPGPLRGPPPGPVGIAGSGGASISTPLHQVSSGRSGGAPLVHRRGLPRPQGPSPPRIVRRSVGYDPRHSCAASP